MIIVITVMHSFLGSIFFVRLKKIKKLKNASWIATCQWNPRTVQKTLVYPYFTISETDFKSFCGAQTIKFVKKSTNLPQ